MRRLLLVEDESSIAQLLKMNFEMEGFHVELADNGLDAFDKYEEERFDILVLDIMLPKQSGLQLCKKIRLIDSKTPIIFLSAKSSTSERIEGLRLGADDYVTKPFHFEELLLRVENVIARSNEDSIVDLEKVEFGSNWVNFETFEAFNGNEDIILTKKEAYLLKLLIENKNKPVSRKEILEYVWGYDVIPSTRTIDNFILMLRKYFEQNPKSPEHIISVRGIGYKFIE